MIYRQMDMEAVKGFMLLPEIYRYASEHGSIKEDAEFVTNGRKVWLAYSVDGQNVGLIDLHIETGTMAQFHPYILREFKERYDHLVKQMFEWFIKFIPEQIVKFNAYIPENCIGAIKAAKTARMQIEGIDRDSYLTSEGACDRILFGITRGELKRWAI